MNLTWLDRRNGRGLQRGAALTLPAADRLSWHGARQHQAALRAAGLHAAREMKRLSHRM